ncbi:hypothetical protein Tco_0496107 [Tanacetum coccineum]
MMKDVEAKDEYAKPRSLEKEKTDGKKDCIQELIRKTSEAMKTPSIATYKIIKQGEKGAYQIVREDGTDVVYINFGAMLKVIF